MKAAITGLELWKLLKRTSRISLDTAAEFFDALPWALAKLASWAEAQVYPSVAPATRDGLTGIVPRRLSRAGFSRAQAD